MTQPKETRELKCVLTDEEVLAYSREMAKQQQDKYEQETALAAVKADYKDKIAKCDTISASFPVRSRTGMSTGRSIAAGSMNGRRGRSASTGPTPATSLIPRP